MSPIRDEKVIGICLDVPSYVPPQQGFLSYLPSSWVPYAELVRLTRPIGVMIIYCPFLFGTLFAAAISDDPPSPYVLLKIEAVLLMSTVFLRGCVVAFNDIADRDLDGQIARTHHRPLARKAISPFKAYIFAMAQAAVWLAILARMFPTSLRYAILSLGIAGFYPYSKRFTDFTPVVLGFTMACGVFIGCAATDVDPLSLALKENSKTTATALFSLYLSCAVWTVIYETVYAHQDSICDEKQGVRSMAIRLKGRAKATLALLSILEVALLACTGWLMGAGPLYFPVSCFGAGSSLGAMIWKVDLKQPYECWWWFSNGTWLVGGSIAAGFIIEICDSR